MRTFPIILIEDRYGGAYSGGKWLAIREATAPTEDRTPRIDFVMEGGPYGCDLEACEFWYEPPDWIFVGNTPQEALDKLNNASRDIL